MLKINDGKQSAKLLAMTGMMICVTAVLAFTPLGTIPLSFVEITIAHVPAIITAMTVGFVPSLIVGFALGIMSLIRASAMPMTPLDPFFINPLVSVLPRILIALTTYFAFTGVRKIMSRFKAKNPVSIAVAACCGSATNTVLVLLIMYFIYISDLREIAGAAGMTVEAVFIGIATLNGISEMIAASVLSVLVVLAVQKAGYSRVK